MFGERDERVAMETEAKELVFRDLCTLGDYEACVALQRAVWGKDFADPVPVTLLKVSQRVGGVLIGAFDGSGQLVGFVFGLTGVREGRLVHWSHMLAVRPEARSLGLGRRLKVLQRERLLETGVERSSWTYDPLVARNAHLNLNRLGAEVEEYVPDMYGPVLSAAGAPGFGTDRFIVTWRLADERVERTLAGYDPVEPEVAAAAEDAPVVNAVPGSGGELVPVDGELVRAPVVCVAIPGDVEGIRGRAPAVAAAWRASTRRAFLHYLGAGYRVMAFRSGGLSGRCLYVLGRSSGG